MGDRTHPRRRQAPQRPQLSGNAQPLLCRARWHAPWIYLSAWQLRLSRHGRETIGAETITWTRRATAREWRGAMLHRMYLGLAVELGVLIALAVCMSLA